MQLSDNVDHRICLFRHEVEEDELVTICQN
jgi:hypothetical protein